LYNYTYNDEDVVIGYTDVGAVPTTSTIYRIHYGGEPGSTVIKKALELSVGDDRKSHKIINADENLALAA